MRPNVSSIRFAVAPSALLIFASVLLVGCGESAPALPGEATLTEVEEGTPRDEVMALLPQGELSVEGTFEGYRRNRYLTDGRMVEVVWIHRQGSGGDFVEPRSDLTPVIFVDAVLDGWGWDHFDARAEEWSLPVPEAPLTGAADPA